MPAMTVETTETGKDGPETANVAKICGSCTLFDFCNFAGMRKNESLADFYQYHTRGDAAAVQSLMAAGGAGHFNVYRREDFFCHKPAMPSPRRDFYKISLITDGEGMLEYADRRVEIKGNVLIFSNPLVPYIWEIGTEKQTGYFCLFTEDFIDAGMRSESLRESSLFKVGGDYVYTLNDEQVRFLDGLFEKMITEISSGYAHKYDLVRNYVNLVIHEALKLQPAQNVLKQLNAAARITSLFMELLERQFPVDDATYTLPLRTAADFANHLSVHVNHLNRAVKEVTGRTTSAHIAGRVAQEAKALLHHTDWNISEIAYSLGFEYPAYFNNFFKKQTGTAPTAYRKAAV